MNVTRTVEAAVLAHAIEHRVLVVEGEQCTHWVHGSLSEPCGPDCDFGTPNPSFDLVALVGKVCETCGGGLDEAFQWRDWATVAMIQDCPDCHGSGRALLTLTDVPRVAASFPVENVVPIVEFGAWEITCRPVPAVTVDDFGNCIHMYERGGEGAYGRPINLGPDPVSKVGQFAVLLDDTKTNAPVPAPVYQHPKEGP